MSVPIRSDTDQNIVVSDPLSRAEDVDDFINVLSHDIRSSVRALKELPKWIEEDLIEDGHMVGGSLADNLNLMNTHMSRLDQMLSDLLEYSRVGRKQTVQIINLKDAIHQVVEELNLPKGFHVKCDLQCKTLQMGEVDVLVLFRGLLSNSVKHHHRDRGMVQIRTRVEGNVCVLSYQDDGPGIPVDQRDLAFEPMKTLKPRDEVEGSGMGLATVNKILNTYGGRVTWLPDPAQGGLALELWFPMSGQVPIKLTAS